MIACPYCGSEVIPGSDVCDDCQHSLTDIGLPEPASEMERGLLSDVVASLEPRKPVTLGPSASIREALTAMVDGKIGCVMIIDNQGGLLGIFTERDALKKVNADFEKLGDKPLHTVMTPKPDALALDDKIAFALHKMNLGGYRHVPILEDGRLAGVISIRDILSYLTSQAETA